MAFSNAPVVLEVERGINSAVRPIQGALNAIAAGVSSALGGLGEIDQLRTDHARLHEESDRLAAENARLQEIRRENELLAGLLQVHNGFDHETVAVQVIARESSEFRQLVTVDKGTDDGIARGDVVIAKGGSLAGRIVEIGPNFAKVLLITDTDSTVTGQLPSAATGEVRGQVNGVLVMGRIDATEQVQLGSEVVTAGIQLAGGALSAFPKGLLIGQVIDVQHDPNAILQTAYLMPAAELDRLEWALVITDYVGGLQPLEVQPQPCGPSDDGTLPNAERPCVSPPPTLAPAP
ncbi:MAG: rod shape-determining protein MreC [Chloroflexota bacterium]|nr:rod shape-determining protein MreC [Chloroflexota bacterium]